MLPQRVAGFRVEQLNGLAASGHVVWVERRDGVKLNLGETAWLLVRPSGTEPVLRVYAEAPDDDRVLALLNFGEEIARKA